MNRAIMRFIAKREAALRSEVSCELSDCSQ